MASLQSRQKEERRRSEVLSIITAAPAQSTSRLTCKKRRRSSHPSLLLLEGDLLNLLVVSLRRGSVRLRKTKAGGLKRAVTSWKLHILGGEFS
jgi:hypothetical protein